MVDPDFAEDARARGIESDKDVVRAVNLTCDWLKHWNDRQPEKWTVEPDEAMFMIFRAVEIYEHHVKRSTQRIRWFHSVVRRYLADLETQTNH